MMRRATFLAICMPLVACGTYTTPAAVQISDGRQMVGSATAAASGGTFHVTDGQGFDCNGTYDAFDTSRILRLPLICSDGRIGTVTIQRTPDLLSGAGTFVLNDGTRGQAAFGKLASGVLTASIQEPEAAPASYEAPIDSARYETPPAQNITTQPVTTTVLDPLPPIAPIRSNLIGAGQPVAPAAQVVRSNFVSPSSQFNSTGRSYIRGPRGGCYYVSASGNKQYVDRSVCGGGAAPATLYNTPSQPSYGNYTRGPRGGCYSIRASGTKKYVSRSLCG